MRLITILLLFISTASFSQSSRFFTDRSYITDKPIYADSAGVPILIKKDRTPAAETETWWRINTEKKTLEVYYEKTGKQLKYNYTPIDEHWNSLDNTSQDGENYKFMWFDMYLIIVIYYPKEKVYATYVNTLPASGD